MALICKKKLVYFGFLDHHHALNIRFFLRLAFDLSRLESVWRYLKHFPHQDFDYRRLLILSPRHHLSEPFF